MKIRTKIIGMGLLLVLLTASSIVGIALYQKKILKQNVDAAVEQLVRSDTTNVAKNVYLMVRSMQESLEKNLVNGLNVVNEAAIRNGPLVFNSSSSFNWEAINQYNGEKLQVSLPKVLHKERWLGHNRDMGVPTPIVDRVAKQLGMTCTIFQRINEAGDMLRIATTVPTRDGQRAIGTYIPRHNPDGSSNPVVETLLQGETYTGGAYVVNDWYLTAYQPLWDSSGTRVVGALYVGQKREYISSLRKGITDIVIGKSGYVAVFQGRGKERGKYHISKDGRWDGVGFLHGEGTHFNAAAVQQVIKKALSLDQSRSAEEEIPTAYLKYRWQNLDESQPRNKGAAIAYFAPWDWVILATAYDDDYIDTQQSMVMALSQMIVWIVRVAVVAILLSLLIGYFVAHGIVRPLNQAVRIFSRIGQGQLDQQLNVAGQDEIGQLSRSFNQMVTNLKEVAASRDDLNHEIIERRRMEKELRESKELLSATLSSIGDGVISTDAHGRVVSINGVAESLTGWKSSEAFGCPIGEKFPIFDARTREGVENPVAQCLREGRKVELANHTVLQQRNGTEWHIDDSCAPIFDSAGQIMGAVLVFRDVTSQYRHRQQLQEERERLANVLWGTGAGTWEWNVQTGETHFNDHWAEMIGYTLEDLSPVSIATWTKFLHPADQQAAMGALERHFQGETGSYECEFRMRHQKGHWIWVLDRGKVVSWTEDGKPLWMAGTHQDITERKKAEETLRKKERDLRESQRIAHVGSWRLDVATNQVFWTEELYNMYGLDPSLPPPPYTEHMKLFTRESWERLSTAMAHTRDTGIPYTLELETVREDGSNGWMWVWGEVEVDTTGKTVEFWGAAQDITERKQTETYREMGREILQILNEPGDMKESIRRILATLKTWTRVDAVGLRHQAGEDFPYFAEVGFTADFLQTENTLLERSKDGGLCRDKNGNVCLECTCGLVIAGKTDASNPMFTKGGSFWINDSLPLLDLPSDQDPRMNPRNNCIHLGYVSVALIPVRTRDRIVGLMQLNDKRQDRFTLEKIEILEDIAAHIGSALIRRQGEEELRESEEKFRSFVENVNDIIFSLTQEGILSYVSPNWFFFMGEPDESAVGRSLQQYIHPDDVPLFCEYLSQITLQWDKKTSVEYRIRHRDGTWLWHTSNASALRSQDGASLGYLGVARDITENKKMRAFMVQTEKVISLGTMAAGMAHEINNPLSIMSQGVQNVLRRTRDDLPGNHRAALECDTSLADLQQYMEKRNVYRSLEAVLDAVKRSSDIVNNMLQFSRRSDLHPVACDINQILERTITLAATDYDLKKKYDFRNIRILKEFSLQTEVPCICSELEQVFLNMLRNSAQSFEKVERNEPTIILRTWEDPETNWAFVEIEDNGCGIEEQSLQRIFDPFFTTKKVGEGTGLGLAVSHHIVMQRHQGRMIAESEVGEWARLRIQLPLRISY